MKLRLDTAGLRAMIADNPELEVELGKAVLNNIRQDITEDKVQQTIDKVLSGMVEKVGHWQNQRYEVRSDELKRAINGLVNEYAGDRVRQVVEDIVTDKVQQLVHAHVRANIKDILREVVDSDMAKQLVLDKLL